MKKRIAAVSAAATVAITMAAMPSASATEAGPNSGTTGTARADGIPGGGYFVKKTRNKTHCMYVDGNLRSGRPYIYYYVFNNKDEGAINGQGFHKRWTTWTGKKGDYWFEKRGQLSRYDGYPPDGRLLQGPKTRVKLKHWMAPNFPNPERSGYVIKTRFGKTPKLEYIPEDFGDGPRGSRWYDLNCPLD